MNEKEKLMLSILAFPADKCAETAIAALTDTEMHFIGQTDEGAKVTAEDILRIFRNRLMHSQRSGVIECGLSSLVKELETLEPRQIVFVHPFMNNKFAVTAFYDEFDNLIGCVTVDRLNRTENT